ncbi:putative cytochrome P450 [Helianthus annuus]|uniref:Cytochrome P450 n=1 Tax=Helianthus annuus TaxID=4232 RepID=A0A251V934_HELAN|nr:alkane hydroxylase MAH1 [Helianthus annuus]KAF5815158.1 putative cytochrome P450 [Helianthus annuus]KAJ0593675.1 putative cytochrome P450 [Helianthus annuus]KAJ0601621.1 putative cytochrome P450 [Helianthus annuus]KAJ0608690.1 putative cytochrome P450 [Helianthus annuus]KAJ0768740.1 putative cytochrome P450 [Helianthus annuus]
MTRSENPMASIHYSNMLLILIVLFVSAVVFLHRRRRLPITNWPLIGMTPHLLLNIHRIHDYATHILTVSDGTFMFKGPWFANIDMLVTSDPANIHHMLSKNFHNYPKGPEFRKMFDLLGDGIFNSDHELWEIHRKTTMSLLKHPEFHTLLETNIKNKLEKGLLPLLNFVSSHHQETDLQEIFQRFTFDAICVLLLDYDPESLCIDLPFVPCEKAFTDAEEALLWRHILPEEVWKLQRRFGIGKEKKLSDAWKVFDEFIYKCLDLKDENKEEDKSGLLTSLIRGFDGQRGTSGDSRKFIKDTILNLMIAGRDTTSTALSWFFYLLAQNPIVEKNIRDEIKKHLGGRKWESLSIKELGELIYLHGGICEALRLYPPVAFEHKSPAAADVLPSGHAVDEHARIILSFYSMGRMEGIWGEDCMEFKPERWFSSGGGIKHEPSYKFTAFHAGPRTCLGKEMAFVQMKMVATAIIHHYHVGLVEGHNVRASDSILLQMKYGLKVRLFPININQAS